MRSKWCILFSVSLQLLIISIDLDQTLRDPPKNESGVSPVSKRYMRAGIGNDGLFVRISTFTYCIPYILHES